MLINLGSEACLGLSSQDSEDVFIRICTSTSDRLKSMTIPLKIGEVFSADAAGPTKTLIIDARPSLHTQTDLEKDLPVCKEK